jgi:hypothetical protein
MLRKVYRHKQFLIYIWLWKTTWKFSTKQSGFTSANPEEVSDDIIDLLGCKLEDIIHASGKLVLVLRTF